LVSGVGGLLKMGERVIWLGNCKLAIVGFLQKFQIF